MTIKGDWKVVVETELDEFSGVLSKYVTGVRAPEGTICEFLDDYGTDSAANATLIVSAVNACKKINPDNPQAAADSINKVFDALKLTKDTVIIKTEDGYLITYDALRAIIKALANADRRE